MGRGGLGAGGCRVGLLRLQSDGGRRDLDHRFTVHIRWVRKTCNIIDIYLNSVYFYFNEYDVESTRIVTIVKGKSYTIIQKCINVLCYP